MLAPPPPAPRPPAGEGEGLRASGRLAERGGRSLKRLPASGWDPALKPPPLSQCQAATGSRGPLPGASRREVLAETFSGARLRPSLGPRPTWDPGKFPASRGASALPSPARWMAWQVPVNTSKKKSSFLAKVWRGGGGGGGHWLRGIGRFCRRREGKNKKIQEKILGAFCEGGS